jgi:hypothetical protein
MAGTALKYLKNSLVMAKLVSRGYEGEFSKEVNGYKKGATVRVRRPENFTPTSGATLSVADVEEATTTVTVDQQYNKGLSFTGQELTLLLSGGEGLKRVGDEKIGPLMHAFANKVDSDLHGLYTSVYNWVGTPGQTIDSFPDFLKGTERMDEFAVPSAGRNAVLSPADNAGLLGAFHNLNQNAETAKNALQRARLPLIGNCDAYMSQNVRTHTVGVATGTPLVNGGSQNVTYAASKATWTQSLVTDGWTNSTTGILKAGDIITIANVFAVNPIDGATLPFLRQFTVTADANSGASTGPATLTISPPIITSGAYKTCSAAPADNAAITVLGTGATGYRQNMIFHKSAFHLAIVPMELDEVMHGSVMTDDGVSVRVTRAFDITNDVSTFRFDILYGVKCLRPDLAVRLSGTS